MSSVPLLQFFFLFVYCEGYSDHPAEVLGPLVCGCRSLSICPYRYTHQKSQQFKPQRKLSILVIIW